MTKKFLVIGAGGVLGLEIVKRLVSEGRSVVATYRTERTGLNGRLRAIGAKPIQIDMAETDRLQDLVDGVDGVIATPILTVAKGLANLKTNARLLFFSSNNVAIDPSNPVYRALADAECDVQAARPEARIIRPTMIYGYPGDGNIDRLLRQMTRFRIAPLPGSGSALQRPIFVDDLADIAAAMMLSPDWRGGVSAAAGPEALTLSALYDELATASGKRVFIVKAPLWPLKLLAAGPLRNRITKAQIDRIEKDKGPIGPDIQYGTTSFSRGCIGLINREVNNLDAAPNDA